MFLQSIIAIIVIIVAYNLFKDILDIMNKDAFTLLDSIKEDGVNKYLTLDPSTISTHSNKKHLLDTKDDAVTECKDNCLGYIEYEDKGLMHGKTKRSIKYNKISSVNADAICMKHNTAATDQGKEWKKIKNNDCNKDCVFTTLNSNIGNDDFEFGALPNNDKGLCDQKKFINHEVEDAFRLGCHEDPVKNNDKCKVMNKLNKVKQNEDGNFDLTFNKEMIKQGDKKYALIIGDHLMKDGNVQLTEDEDKVHIKVGTQGQLCSLKNNKNKPSGPLLKFFDHLKKTKDTTGKSLLDEENCEWREKALEKTFEKTDAGRDMLARLNARDAATESYTYDHCAEWGYKNTNDGDEKPPKIPLPPNEITGKSEGNYMVMCETDANIEDCNRWKYCIKEKEMSTDASGWGDKVLNKERKKEVSPSAATMTAQQSAKNQMPIDQNAPPHKFDKTGGSRPLTEGRMYEIMNDLLVSHRMPVSAFILNGSKGLQKPGPGNPQPYDSTFSVF